MSSKSPLLIAAVGLALALALAGCDTEELPLKIVGQLESDRVEIAADVSEPVIGRAVVEGQAVDVGQILIEQDPARVLSRIAEAEAAANQARARLAELIRGPRKEQIVAAQAEVRGAEDELAFRQKEFARAKQVHERQLASPEALDRATATRNTAQASLDGANARLAELLTGTTVEELRQAEEALSQADARIASLAIDLARHRTAAPVAGVIDSLLFEIGERPLAGQALAVLLPGAQPHARVFIPESIRVSVTPGTRARILVDGLNQPVDGIVRWVSSEASFTPYFALTERDRGRLTYMAKIDLDFSQRRLPDGVPVEVELLLEPTE